MRKNLAWGKNLRTKFGGGKIRRPLGQLVDGCEMVERDLTSAQFGGQIDLEPELIPSGSYSIYFDANFSQEILFTIFRLVTLNQKGPIDGVAFPYKNNRKRWLDFSSSLAEKKYCRT